MTDIIFNINNIVMDKVTSIIMSFSVLIKNLDTIATIIDRPIK